MYNILVSRKNYFSKILKADNEFDLTRSLNEIINIIGIESVILRDEMVVVRTSDFIIEIKGSNDSLKVVMEHIQEEMAKMF